MCSERHCQTSSPDFAPGDASPGLLASVFDQAGVGLCLVGPNDRVLMANAEWLATTGLTLSQVIGSRILDLFPEMRAMSAAIHARARSGERVLVPRHHQRVGGRETWWEGTVSPVPMEGGVGVLVSAREVSAQIEAERKSGALVAELREANQRLSAANSREKELVDLAERRASELDTLVGSIADALYVCGVNGRMRYLNPAAQALLGGYESAGETLLTLETPRGRLFPPSMLPCQRALRGETLKGEQARLRTADGGLVWLCISAAPLCGPDDGIVGAVVVITDVTSGHNLQEQMEDLIHTISHDLRNPLTALMGHTQLIQRFLASQGAEQQAQSVDAILKASRRMNMMIQDLVDSARLESGRMEIHKEPTDLLHFTTDLVQRTGTTEDRSRIFVESPGTLPLVPVDPGRLERAVVNMLTNAMKYSPADRPIVVRVSERGTDAIISVMDHGPGIPAEEQPRLFERFYRARADKQTDGLGLGLYIVRLIAEAHGGRAWLESQVGKGSTFYISVPTA